MSARLTKCLLDELKCSLCQDTVVEPVCINVCLHRFCKTCLAQSLKYGWLNCPNCRQPFFSKRNIISDYFCQNILNILELEKSAQEAEIENTENIDDECTGELIAMPAEYWNGPCGVFFLCHKEKGENDEFEYVPVDRQPYYVDDKNRLNKF